VEQSFQFRDNIDGGLSALGDMISMTGRLSTVLSTLMKDTSLADVFKGLGGALPLFGAVFSLGSSISTAFNQAREERNAEAQANFDLANQRQLKATEAMTKALQMQLEFIEVIYCTQRLEEYERSLSEIESTYRDLNDAISGRYLMTGDSFTNDILQRLNTGETQKQILDSFALVSKE